MEHELEQLNSYRVEVSGWDAAENFFVEKTTLRWKADREKEVRLGRVLTEETVVFVRLLRPLATRNNFPIAYRAKRAPARGTDGKWPVWLTQLRRNGMSLETCKVSESSAVAAF